MVQLDLLNDLASPVTLICGAVRVIYSHELTIPPSIVYAREDDCDHGVLLLDRGHGADYMDQKSLDVFGKLLLLQWSMSLDNKWPWDGPPVERTMQRAY